MKSLFLLLFLVLAVAMVVQAHKEPKHPKHYRGAHHMTIVNEDITVRVTVDGLPRLIISSNNDNGTQYHLRFNSMYQVSNRTEPWKNKVGKDYSLSSYQWNLGDTIINGDTITFSLSGMKDSSDPFVTFIVHVNSTGMSYKFDVNISNFQNDMWVPKSIGLATCYTASVKFDGGKDEQNKTVRKTDRDNEYSFGPTLSIIPYATLGNSTLTVPAELQPGSAENVACIVYGSFYGESTELIHDPTVGISAASTIPISFLILLLVYILIV
jgi:hypothetical protein